jgi:Arc/MetJ-type ribon-helix-helix transcriptional regulator
MLKTREMLLRLGIEGLSMAGVDTIAAQVSHDSQLHERFEEYEEDRRFETRSEAVRALLRAGLDQYEEEQEQHREDARTSTGVEEWLQERARSWLGFGVLSLAGFGTMFALFALNSLTAQFIPDWPISLAMFASLLGFLMFTGASMLATVALRTGLARRLAQFTAGESEVEA